MGKIFHMMGKSASGKDTLFGMLLAAEELHLHRIVPCTTRPMRSDETPGIQYYFKTKEELDDLTAKGKVIEQRCYQTIHGDWYYFTVDDGQIDLENKNYLMIGTFKTYEKIRNYFGAEKVVPLYISLNDGERLTRALQREKMQKEPKYKEMCRRFLADEEDFSMEKQNELGIKKSFENDELTKCFEEIKKEIMNYES